jgi:DNA-directed RNA polymerase specialized sigma24 family protein
VVVPGTWSCITSKDQKPDNICDQFFVPLPALTPALRGCVLTLPLFSNHPELKTGQTCCKKLVLLLEWGSMSPSHYLITRENRSQELDKERQARVKELTALVTKVAISDKMKEKSTSTVSYKLGGFFKGNELVEIEEDAFGRCIALLLGSIQRSSMERLSQLFSTDDPDKEMRQYINRSVTNYCNSRLRRWSLETEEGKYGYAARFTVPSVDSNQAESLGDENIWDEFSSTKFSSDKIELDAIIQRMLDSGISEEDMGYVEARYRGVSWEDLAAKNGGTPDKYRKRVRRIYEKLATGF